MLNTYKVLVYENDPSVSELFNVLLQEQQLKAYIGHAHGMTEDFLTYHPHLIIIDDWLLRCGNLSHYLRLEDMAKRAEVPLILTTTFHYTLVEAKELGASGILFKPFDLSVFDELIARFLPRGDSYAD